MKKRTLPLFVTVSLVSGSALAEYFVSYDNALIPAGLRPGDSFHLAFATSTITKRDSGGGLDNFPISQWNTFVDNAAAASTVTSIKPTLTAINWNAIVSTSLVAARDNALITAPVYRLDKQLVASGFSDMWDGSLSAGIVITEKLTTVPPAQDELVWSGTTTAGLASSLPLGNGAGATTGRASATATGWIAGSGAENRSATTALRMYALSEKITIATPPDADTDGLPDWFETAYSSSSTGLAPGDDSDQDGLTALQEYILDFRLSPIDPDTDNDGLLDGANITLTSADARYAAWATTGFAYFDDGTQRTFRGEVTMGTSPIKPDTDADGLLDGAESKTGVWVSATNTGTDPVKVDTDGDALKDGIETNTGVFVSRTTNTGTNPLLADTDSDGAGDWYEAAASLTNPNSAVALPSIPYPLPPPNNTIPAAANKPVKVFILSGQSNMVGIGYVTGPKPGSLDVITKQEGKFPNLLDASKNYLSRQDVWYEGVYTATAKKWLAPGCGNGPTTLGPELGFGQVMGWFHDEPVLIIKASQGNRSLGWDILPPGSPSYDYTNGKTYAGYGGSPASWTTGTTPAPGSWYAGKEFDQFFKKEADWARPTEAPLYNVADVLDEFDTKFPQWAAQGFEIAGFAWFQGYGDQGEPYASRYEENLVRLIQQVRSYYENRYPGKVATNAPFAVGAIGFGGQPFVEGTPSYKVHAAQLAVGDPVKYPAFAGNVKSVDTLPYWRELDESPGIQGYHYNNSAETYMLVGDGLGRIMVDMLKGEDTFPPAPNPMSFLIPPSAIDATTIGMVATTASDQSGPVEYFFECTAGGGPNSSWQLSPSYTVSGLATGTTLTYRVQARDSVLPVRNETGWSAGLSATAQADTTSPTPSPMTFATPPTATGPNSITMTAATALDINGVQYQFDCTLGGGPDSAWQDNPVFNASALTTGVSCTYVVRARDKSNAHNTTTDSVSASATPEPIPDTTSPQSNFLNPINGANGILANAALTIGFDEDVVVGSGFITLKNLTNGTQAQISVSDATQVVFAGDTVTITPAAGLLQGRNYAVRIDATAIKDLSDNLFAGIANDSTWSFTILDDTAPLVSTLSPVDNSVEVSPKTNLVVTFSEAIQKGNGFVTLKNITDGTQTQIAITDATQITVSGSTLIINPASDLAQQKLHAIRIDSGSINDLAGNAFTGIGDDSTWSFTTRLVIANILDPTHPLVPPGIAPGQSFQVVFVTSTKIDRDSLDGTVNSTDNTTIAHWNTYVNTIANTSSIEGFGDINWTAIASTAAVAAKVNAVVSAPVYLTNKTLFATGFTDMWDGSAIPVAILYDEDGVMINTAGSSGAGRLVWTGTTATGTSGALPLGSGTAGSSTGSTGSTPSGNLSVQWIANTGAENRATTNVLRVYGLSEVLTVAGGITVSPFADWADDYPGLTNSTASLDFDGGSLPTGIEWVVGGNPTTGNDDAGLAPTLDNTTDSNGKLLFIFHRTTAAGADANTTIRVEYGSDLSGWTPAIHQGTGPSDITISEVPNGFGAGIDKVTVALPESLASTGRLFARLKVLVVTP